MWLVYEVGLPEMHSELTVASELVNGGEKVLKVVGVVRPVQRLEVRTVEGVLGSAGIKSEVDAGFVKHTHSLLVVSCIVHGVDTNSVDSKLPEHLNVGSERLGVEKRVRSVGSSTGLVSHTADEEAVLTGHEGIAGDGDLRVCQYSIQWPRGLTMTYRREVASLALLNAASESSGDKGGRRDGSGKNGLHDECFSSV